MLVVTRKIGETLRIGPDITVAVVGFRGNQVQVGVQADGHVVLRGELVTCEADLLPAEPPTQGSTQP